MLTAPSRRRVLECDRGADRHTCAGDRAFETGRAAGARFAEGAIDPLGVRLQGSTPAQAQALVAAEIKRWGEVIRAAKIRPQ